MTAPDAPLPDDDAASDEAIDHAAAIDDYLGGFAADLDTPADTPGLDRSADEAGAVLLDTILLFRQKAAGDGAAPRVAAVGGPRSIGRHAILRRAGEGGFATVWEGFDTTLRRPVAVKVLRPELLLSADARRRFVREAEIAARLVHPHIVTIFEVGEDAGREFIATEFCSGGSLAGWLQTHPDPLPPHDAARLVRALAGAVACAHAAGVVHRDIKPANVMLVPVPAGTEPLLRSPPGAPDSPAGDGFTVKLGDFGLGKLHDGDEADPLTQLTRSGASLGTPAWMAPEQIDRSFGTVGPGTDVHALGLLLDRLLTGRALRGAGTTAEVYRQVLVDEVPAADRVVRGVPRDLAAVSAKCLAKQPADRYPSAAALADDLDRWLDGRPTVARPLSSTGRAARWIRRRPVVAALGAAAVLASAAAGWAGLAQLRTRREAAAREDEISRQRAAAELRRGFEALEAGNVAGALERLEATRGSDPALAASLAGRWLLRRTHGERAILMAPDEPTTDRPRALYTIAIAPDGASAAVAAADGTVRLIRALDGTPVITTVAAHDEVNEVAFSADGKRLVTAGQDGRLRWWDVTDAGLAPVGAVDPAAGPLYAAAFSPDGRTLACGGADRVVRLVRLAEPDRAVELFQCPAPPGRSPDLESLVFTDEAGIAAACGDQIVLIDAETGGLVREFELPFVGNRETVLGSLAVSPDGRRLIACGTDTKAHLWDLATGRKVLSLPAHPAWVQGCCFVGDGDRVATACRDGGIRVFDAASGAPLTRLVGHEGRVWAVAAEPAGTLLSCGADGTVRRWNPADDFATATIHPIAIEGNEIVRIAEVPRGSADRAPGDLIALDHRHVLRRVDLARGTSRPLPHPERGRAFNIDVEPTGRRLSVALEDEDRLLVLDLAAEEAGRCSPPPGPSAAWTLAELPAAVSAARAAPCWLRDGGLVVSGWAGGVCRLSNDLSRATLIDAPLEPPVHELVAAPSGPERVAAIGKVTAILSVRGGGMSAPPATLVLPVGAETTAVSWSPDGRTIACGTNAGRVMLFDTVSGVARGQLAPQERFITGVAYAADGRILVTADTDSVRLCDAATLTTLDEFRPGWQIRKMRLAADGARIVLAGRTGADPGTGAARLAVVEMDAP
ncbi:MAG: WD40 repeat domain-containing serine/threonine protein kinase [Planctomycetaceae bacterium]